MERLQLKIDTGNEDGAASYSVEVPYKDGLAITNEFCPVELLSDKVELYAAIRGEPLEKFVEDCRKQVVAMNVLNKSESESMLDVHIGGLMAVVMDHLSREKKISYSQLLFYVDCFSLLLKGAGFEDKEIREIYPSVMKTIQELYFEFIDNYNFTYHINTNNK